ncbi:hypothetical protein V1525DRAFT_348996 [Lipomyces kononenkoae]|uniref:Uncharacterized protein n=1 Tax=Lipomyces kononenkoae TaxID=34357 RepID=A0ACC3SUN2_LIPKO
MQQSVLFRNESFDAGDDNLQELKRNLSSMSTSLSMSRQNSCSRMDLPWEIVISTPNGTWAELDCYFYDENSGNTSMPDLQTLIRKAKGRTKKIRTWSTYRHTADCPDDGNWIVENAQFLNNLTALSLGYLGEPLRADTFNDDVVWGVIYRLTSLQLSLPFTERLFERIDAINDSVALPNLRLLDCYYDECILGSTENCAMLLELDLDGSRGPPDYVMFPELRSFRIGSKNISHQDAAVKQVTVCDEQLRILLSGMPKLEKFGCSGMVVQQRPEIMPSPDCFFFYNHMLEEIDLSGSTWHHLPTLPLGLKSLNLMLTTCRPSLSPPVGIMKFPRLEYIHFRGHGFTPGLKNSDVLNLFRVCNGPTITTLILSALPGIDFAGRYNGEPLTRIIAMYCPNLEHLDISYNVTVDDDSLSELCELKHLRYLDLSGTFITYYGLSMLFCNGKMNLESLILEASLVDTAGVRDHFNVNVDPENNLSHSLQDF